MATATPTPAAMASKWAQGIQQGAAAYSAGTAAVTESPTAKAAANLNVAAANYANSVNSGQMAAALNAVSLSSWKQSCATGASKFAGSAQKGLPKYTAYAQSAIPVYAAMKSAAQQQTTPQGKVVAALNVIIASGKRGKAAGMTA